MIDFCTELRNNDLVSLNEPNAAFKCWPENFKSYLEANTSMTYPIEDEQTYREYIEKWV